MIYEISNENLLCSLILYVSLCPGAFMAKNKSTIKPF